MLILGLKRTLTEKAMHRNFNHFKNETMTALEFIKKNYPKYNEDFVHTDIEINGCRLEELLEEYHQAKLKLLGIADVSDSLPVICTMEDDKGELGWTRLSIKYAGEVITNLSKKVKVFEGFIDSFNEDYR